MPERSLDGIQIAETPNAGQSIARNAAQSTAFVGRALRGPLNHPTIVRSFADFQQVFGGLWQPSPLSYAVEQFFEQGGRQAVIVRVANGAAPVTISLRCGNETLRLEACAPGTREFLRASVDYDHIPGDDPKRFNLVIQRVRAPGSERIEEQETCRALSVDPEAARFITTALLESKLARVRGTVPKTRPDRTLMPGTNLPVGYVSSNPDGDDGRPISDYDIIGSAPRRSGIFALDATEDLAFLYIPALSRTTDIGASALLVAIRFCRERRIMLIVDPPSSWETPNQVITKLRELNFYSHNAVMFYPRLVAMDRLRGRAEIFGNGGAVAGMLSRSGDVVSAAVTTPEPEPLLRASARLAREVDRNERSRLSANGINVLSAVRSAERGNPVMRTLTCGGGPSSDWALLAQRRLALFVVNAIERGTRWAVAAPRDRLIWERLAVQVREFLEDLRVAGAFASVPQDQAYLVICDERINDDAHAVNILVQFAAVRPGERHCYMITHSARGATVRTVTMNRLDPSMIVSHELQQEITIRLHAGPEALDSLSITIRAH